MYYVYLLKSLSDSTQTYVSGTQDLDNRLKRHNAGYSSHTSRHIPWEIVSYVAVPTEKAAVSLEKYLKSGSGRVFIQKRLLGNI